MGEKGHINLEGYNKIFKKIIKVQDLVYFIGEKK